MSRRKRYHGGEILPILLTNLEKTLKPINAFVVEYTQNAMRANKRNPLLESQRRIDWGPSRANVRCLTDERWLQVTPAPPRNNGNDDGIPCDPLGRLRAF